MKNKNRFLNLSTLFLILNQFCCLCLPYAELSTIRTETFEATTLNSLNGPNTDSDIEYDKPVERSPTINGGQHETTIYSDNESSLKSNASKDIKEDNFEDDIKIGDLNVEDLTVDDFRNNKDDTNDEDIGDMNRSLDRYEIQNDASDDDHSEIEVTTLASIFDNINFTLPSLSRMIDMSEQGELDILNKTHPRRLLIDMDANEEIIVANDIDKLSIDNELNFDDQDDYLNVLRAPGI